MSGKVIIINATALGSHLNGIAVYLRALICGLAALKTPLPCIIYLNKNAMIHFQKQDLPPWMMIRYVSRFVSPDYGFFGHTLRLLYSNLLSVRHSGSPCFNGSQLEAMLFRANQVIMIHDIIPLLVPGDHLKQYFFFKYILRLALGPASAIITPSLTVKECLRESYGVPGCKVHVIHHGVEHAIAVGAAPEEAESESFILFVGRKNRHKNLSKLLAGFNLLRNALPHKIVVVGMEDYQLHDGEPGRIVFRGYVSEREKVLLYKKAALLVFPSLHEGFGLPPLEAMLHGCPVVASRSSCIPEVCGDAAYYVDPNNAVSIAEGIHRVATDRVLREGMIRRGIERTRIFSWHNSAEKHAGLFLDLLAARVPNPPEPENGEPLRSSEPPSERQAA